MNIAVINRKGGTSKSKLSKYLVKELNRVGTKSKLVDTDTYHSNMTHDDTTIYNPSDEEYDALLESNDTMVFDTGGLLLDTTDTLAKMCDLILIPTSIYKIELDELMPLLERFEKLGIDTSKAIIVPTRIHHTITDDSIANRLDYGVSIAPPMRMRADFAHDRPNAKCDEDMYNIVNFIKEYSNELCR